MEAKLNNNNNNNNNDNNNNNNNNSKNVKTEIVKMGVLEIFYKGSWRKCDCVTSSTTLTCYENDKVVFSFLFNYYLLFYLFIYYFHFF